MVTKFYKTTDGKYLKLDYDYFNDSYNPRDHAYQTTLGTMVFSKIKNPNRSDNGGVNNALLIDYENRRFAYVSGASQMIDKPSETYLKKVEELSSKAVEKKLGTLVKAGFKNAALNSESLNMYRKDDKWISKYILKEPGRGI